MALAQRLDDTPSWHKQKKTVERPGKTSETNTREGQTPSGDGGGGGGRAGGRKTGPATRVVDTHTHTQVSGESANWR